MARLIFLFLLLFTKLSFGDESRPEIRILKLLPYFVQPPMIEPCLPKDFTLGREEEDPYFSKGYLWGSPNTLEDYFGNMTQLKECLIHAQVSSNVFQLGHDRFSNDGNTQDLNAAGFTEIKVNRGRWGIFPFRELQAKSPKGRRYYQLWVGLNALEGATLFFQFIYPDYLNEPTQTQKSIWSNFVKKTDLMSLSDMMVARGMINTPEHFSKKSLESQIGLKVEKRRLDQKYFIYAENIDHLTVLNIKEKSFLEGLFFRQSLIEIEALLGLHGEERSEALQTSYQVVDSFSFKAPMLHLGRFQEKDNIILFY